MLTLKCMREKNVKNAYKIFKTKDLLEYLSLFYFVKIIKLVKISKNIKHPSISLLTSDVMKARSQYALLLTAPFLSEHLQGCCNMIHLLK